MKIAIHRNPADRKSRMKIILFLTFTIALFYGLHAQDKPVEPKLVKTIPLPGVHGKFDHMAVDVKNNKLFLAAKGNNSVEVIDLTKGVTIHSIKQVSAPQGILFLPTQNTILVCGGGDGTLKGFDASTYEEKFSLTLGGEADNIRYSAPLNKLYIAYGDGALAVVDSRFFKKLSEIPCFAHPEAFAIDSSGKKIWSNVPDIGIVKVIDVASEKEIASWKTASQSDNFPITLLENCNKLVTASRSNPEISILNSENGKLIQSIPCDEDPDALFYDLKTDRVFLSCGGGSLYIFDHVSKDNLEKPKILATRKGARTCLWNSELKSLFAALPEIDGKNAEIRIYQY